VRARTGQGHLSGYPLLLTPEPVPADGERLELELSRPHLAIRLLSSDGGEWTGAPVAVQQQSFRDERTERWPEVPTIMVFPCTPAGGDEVVQGGVLEGRTTGPGLAIYELPAGARYLVGAQGGGFPGELQVVEVPSGAGRVSVELLAPPPRELGSVSISILHAGRELTGRARDEPEFDVYLESLDTAVVLLSRKEYRETAPFVLTAPAGRYRVVAEGRPYVEHHHGVLMTERDLGRSEVEFDLVAGDTRELMLELDLGTRIELTLAGEGTAGDRAAVLTEWPWLGEPGREEELAAFAARARVYLLRPGRRPEPVYFTTEWGATSAAGTHLEERWPPGAKHVSQVLPTGSYRLVARMPGGRTAAVTVTLRQGETSAVELSIGRRE